MSDTSKTRTFSTAAIAQRLDGHLSGPADLQLDGVNSLAEARPSHVTFIADAAHASLWSSSSAGAAVVSNGLDVPGHDPDTRALIQVADAEQAMIDLLHLWAAPAVRPDPGVHPTAWIHDEAILGDDVRIGAHVSVDRGVVIGAGSDLHAGVRLYPDVTLGDQCVIHANTVIRERCTLGRGVILQPHITIGSDGFGYRPAPDGTGLRKVPQIGTVDIADDVEIGSGTCIDRGKFGPTVIGAGTKIDNLCHIGHNCRIGRSTVIAGTTALSGSVTIGDGVMIGGGVGATPGVTIGDGARVAARSAVMRDVDPGSTVAGAPADLSVNVLRQWAAVRKLPDYMKRESQRS